MTTGTPRQTFLKSQQSVEGGKAWMSFEESPVHSAATTPSNPNQDERWTSFTGPAGATVGPGGGFISPPAPASYPGLQYSENHNRINDDTAMKHGGSLTQTTHLANSPAHRSNTQHIHPPAQQTGVTHGPGSTITHILRHTSADNDHNNSHIGMDNTNHSAGTKTMAVNKGDTTKDMQSMRRSKQKSISDGLKTFHKQPSGDPLHTANLKDDENITPDPWLVTAEQCVYYRNQFQTMQQSLDGKIDGQTARNFFTKSKLPIPELSHIWELCDMDQDGHLTLLEFCAAFHLVVARKNELELPAVLPKSLLPPLISMCGIGVKQPSARPLIDITENNDITEKTSSVQPQPSEKIQFTIVQERVSESSNAQPAAPLKSDTNVHWNTHQNKWETFSDSRASSTNLANFDQGLDHSENTTIVHPVPLRITPSRHESHSAKMRQAKHPKSTDDEEHQPQGLTVPQSHKSLTNPYGSLKNDLSEADSHTSPRARSSSNSSHSSAGTSDRSLSEIDGTFKQPPRNSSDQEYQSDWSSRPLQPRSASDSSIESSSMEASVICEPSAVAPTPPPRPNQPQRGTNAKSDLFKPEIHETEDVPDVGKPSTTAPTPPPRPQQQQSTCAKAIKPSEEFADFSRFEEEKTVEAPAQQTAPPVSKPAKPSLPTENDKTDFVAKEISKPTPAPRSIREEKQAKLSDNDSKEEKSPDKHSLKKAPLKPPRSRIQSVDSAVHDQHMKAKKTNSISTAASDIPSISEKPAQEDSRSKNSLQQSIRDLKLCNSKLTRLNADLQQELKDVMQSRITVEMSIHQLRPFSQ